MRTDRLLKLAEHLETGKLGHKVFNFICFNGNDTGMVPGPHCGTMGCAIGECPVLFPDEWKFSYFGDPVIVSPIDGEISTNRSAEVFFDLKKEAADHLFYPELQCTNLFGGKWLGVDATRYQVAANIRAFVAKMESIDEMKADHVNV